MYEGWAKVFVSLIKMFGTLIVAAFTAIFTNYLLRARLGGVFEVRRIPDSGHVVVIGLGNVGYRVVEELDRLGERPVVVEQGGQLFHPELPAPRGAGPDRRRHPAGDAEPGPGGRRAVVVCTSADLADL